MNMTIDDLIKIVQNSIDEVTSDQPFGFKVYNSLKMDNVKMDINKINGLARVISGSVEPISSLGQSLVVMAIEFIYPYERIDYVNDMLQATAQQFAGKIITNADIGEGLKGTTGVAITYPTQGNYANGTLGETARSTLYCYFDINERAVMSNTRKLEILKPATVDVNTVGVYYVINSQNEVEAKTLPTDYVLGAEYYEYEYVPIYKVVITRHRHSVTNAFKNNKELQTINTVQSIDISWAVPYIEGSVIEQIKDDALSGDNGAKEYYLKIDGKNFNSVIVSGDFTEEIIPGNVIMLKGLFVYKRRDR